MALTIHDGPNVVSYNAAQMTAVIRFPDAPPSALGDLSDVSISVHRDKFPVTRLCDVPIKGFTAGHRMVAGTLVFNTFNQASLPADYLGAKGRHYMADELPLFDILITHVSEDGMASFEILMGVTLLDFSRVMSLNAVAPLETYSYMAMDYRPLRPLTQNPAQRKRLIELSSSNERRALVLFGAPRQSTIQDRRHILP